MKTHSILIMLFSILPHSASGDLAPPSSSTAAVVATTERPANTAPVAFDSKFPLSKALGGQSSFAVTGSSTLSLMQVGETTTVKLNREIIATLQAPEFVRSIVQSEDRRFTLLLIGRDRPEAPGASDYHSILRIKLTREGALAGTGRLLAKADGMMKELFRWIVKIDCVLNDGRTALVYFGEQKDKEDPSMKIRYSWQVRDLDTGKLYRDEPNADDD